MHKDPQQVTVYDAMMEELGIKRNDELSASHIPNKPSRRLPAATLNSSARMSKNEIQAKAKNLRAQQSDAQIAKLNADSIAKWNAKEFKDVRPDDRFLKSIADGDLHRRGSHPTKENLPSTLSDTTSVSYPHRIHHQPPPRRGRGGTRGGHSGGSGTLAEDFGFTIADRMGSGSRDVAYNGPGRDTTRAAPSTRVNSTSSAHANGGDILSPLSNGNYGRGNRSKLNRARGSYNPSQSPRPIAKLPNPALPLLATPDAFLASVPLLLGPRARVGLENSTYNTEGAPQETALDKVAKQKDNVPSQKSEGGPGVFGSSNMFSGDFADASRVVNSLRGSTIPADASRPPADMSKPGEKKYQTSLLVSDPLQASNAEEGFAKETENNAFQSSFRTSRTPREIVLHHISSNESKERKKAERVAARHARTSTGPETKTSSALAEAATEEASVSADAHPSMTTTDISVEELAEASAEILPFVLYKTRARLDVDGQTFGVGWLTIEQDQTSGHIFITLTSDEGAKKVAEAAAVTSAFATGCTVTVLLNPSQQWVFTTQVAHIADNLLGNIEAIIARNENELFGEAEAGFDYTPELCPHLAPRLQYLLDNFTDEDLRRFNEKMAAEARAGFAALINRDLAIGIDNSDYALGNRASIPPNHIINEDVVAKFFTKSKFVEIAPKHDRDQFFAGMTRLLVEMDEKDNSAPEVAPTEPASASEHTSVDEKVGSTNEVHTPVLKVQQDYPESTPYQGDVVPTIRVYGRQELLDCRSSALTIYPQFLPLIQKKCMREHSSELVAPATGEDFGPVVHRQQQAASELDADRSLEVMKSPKAMKGTTQKDFFAESLPLFAASATADNSKHHSADKESFTSQSAVVDVPVVKSELASLPTAIVGSVPEYMAAKQQAKTAYQRASAGRMTDVSQPLAPQNHGLPSTIVQPAQKLTSSSNPVGPIYYQSATYAATPAAETKEYKSELENSAYANAKDVVASKYKEPHLSNKKCNLGRNCENPNCQFSHPESAQFCPYLPKCTKNICPFVHPDCKFGSGCANPDCRYAHMGADGVSAVCSIQAPVSQARGLQAQGLQPRGARAPSPKPPAHCTGISCRYGLFCTKASCPFEHPEPEITCKYDSNCMKPSCNFKHTR